MTQPQTNNKPMPKRRREALATATAAPAEPANPIPSQSSPTDEIAFDTEPVSIDEVLPKFLRVANRVPLTPEQEQALKDRQAALRRPVTIPPGARTELDALKDQRRAKARGRIEKLKAKQAAETAKMPAQGVDALAIIRQYDPAKDHRQPKAAQNGGAPRGITVPAPKRTDPKTRVLVEAALVTKQLQEQQDMNRKTTTKTAKGAARTKVATSSAKAGERSRYDWAGAAERAGKGQIPPAPDFSAPTHERYRPLLSDVVKAAKAGDAGALQKIKVAPTSSSPKAVDRYRKLCLAALKAKAA